MTFDLSAPRTVHLIGIGGAGMGAIATVLHEMGHTVTGSDLKGGPVVERLRLAGIEVAIGHDASNVGPVDAVAISTAIPPHNVERVEAEARGIDVLRRKDLLPLISAARRSLVVAGTHGKTTTSSMLAMAMVEAGLDPAFIIGGDVNEIGTGAYWSQGEWFVVEGDESDQTFLSLGAEIAIITNVEPDHLETYDNDPDQLMAAFVEFARQADQAVYCADDDGAMQVAGQVPGVTYGVSADAHYRMIDVEHGRSSVSFSIEHDGEPLVSVTLPTPGLHNAQNAAAALVATVVAGGDAQAAARALGRFGGVARRFEFRGTASDVTFVDDYAHLPAEVNAVLAAAKSGQWPRIVCVFQPHRYSRTEALWSEFGPVFGDADVVVVTDVYSSGETPRPGVTGQLIVDAIEQQDPSAEVVWSPRLDETATWLVDNLQPGDLCLTLGAGDLTQLPDQIIARLSEPSDQ